MRTLELYYYLKYWRYIMSKVVLIIVGFILAILGVFVALGTAITVITLSLKWLAIILIVPGVLSIIMGIIYRKKRAV